jgi:hypothetical protein
MRRVLIAVAALIGLGAIVVGILVVQDKLRRRRVDQLYMPVLAAANDKDAPRQRAIRAALNGEVVPRPDLGSCTEAMRAGAPTEIIYDVKDGRGAWWLKYLGNMEPLSRRDDLDPAEWAKAARAIDDWDREIDILAETKEFAQQDYADRTEFKPGELAGRVYLYSFREQRILCAGLFHVTNTSGLEITEKRDLRTGKVLSDDFRRQADSQLTSAAQANAQASLVRAGPRR